MKMDNLQHLMINAVLFVLVFLNDPKSKKNELFFRPHRHKLCLRAFLRQSVMIQQHFPRQHYSRQCFRVERFCIMSVQGKQRKSYSIWCLCDPSGLAPPHGPLFHSKGSARITHEQPTCGAGQNRATQSISEMDGRYTPNDKLRLLSH